MKPDSHIYRDNLRYGLHALLCPWEEAALMGDRISNMSMDTLEAANELFFGANPRSLAPAGYRPQRRLKRGG